MEKIVSYSPVSQDWLFELDFLKKILGYYKIQKYYYLE